MSFTFRVELYIILVPVDRTEILLAVYLYMKRIQGWKVFGANPPPPPIQLSWIFLNAHKIKSIR